MVFSKIAKAFKPSGLKVVIEPPKLFNWGHEVLPVTVQLTNRAEEPRTVESIVFQVREKKENEEEFGSQVWEQGVHPAAGRARGGGRHTRGRA